jgi:hypothetical protein
VTELYWKAVSPAYTSWTGLRWDIGATVTHPSSTTMVPDKPETYLSLAVHPTQTLSGVRWPCRLLRVEPIGEVIESGWYRHKRCALSARVVDEVEGAWALGPQGQYVAALLNTARWLTAEHVEWLESAWAIVRHRSRADAWDGAWIASGIAAWLADRDVAWDAAQRNARRVVSDVAYAGAWAAARAAGLAHTVDGRKVAAYAIWDAAELAAAQGAAGVAVRALVVRDLIGRVPGWDQGAYDRLTAPWRRIVGPVHPEDGDV